jgi:hypothetical protein
VRFKDITVVAVKVTVFRNVTFCLNLKTHLLNVHTQWWFTYNKCIMCTNATVNVLAGLMQYSILIQCIPHCFHHSILLRGRTFESRCILGKDMELFEQFLYLLWAGSGWICLFISSREGERTVQEFLLHGTGLKEYVTEQQSQAKYGKVQWILMEQIQQKWALCLVHVLVKKKNIYCLVDKNVSKSLHYPLPFQLANANLLKFQAKQLYDKWVSTSLLHNIHYVVSIS